MIGIICCMGMPNPPKRKLHHRTPAWVKSGEVFHVRIRLSRDATCLLTQPEVARPLLDAARIYHERGRWHLTLFVLMPDHLHALLAFPRDAAMSLVVLAWKSYQTRVLGVTWQDNYFDHRIRSDDELTIKADYIRQNPVVKGLCETANDWPWKIDSLL